MKTMRVDPNFNILMVEGQQKRQWKKRSGYPQQAITGNARNWMKQLYQETTQNHSRLHSDLRRWLVDRLVVGNFGEINTKFKEFISDTSTVCRANKGCSNHDTSQLDRCRKLRCHMADMKKV